MQSHFDGYEVKNMEKIAANINILAGFLGVRDVAELSPAALTHACGYGCADVMALFGGSILCGGDVLAEAMRAGVARKYVIVGGAGHTTNALRGLMHALYPDLETADMPEARLFNEYLGRKYGLQADFLECASTNCGNNITYLLELLDRKGISPETIILTQDASMQRRMDAGLRLHAPDVRIINYAAYAAQAVVQDGELRFATDITGMWDMERYLSLLLGEIPRLRDDEQGYGPMWISRKTWKRPLRPCSRPFPALCGMQTPCLRQKINEKH